MAKSPDSFMFTVGKLDAGMAILLGERAHLIEFPSLLLPPGATTGSVVNISVQQNHTEEKRRESEFWALQNDILSMYGVQSPDPPKLQVRNVTQTSVTLEWPRLELATAKLRSLDIYRNRSRLAAIPSPLTNTSTKLSGLQLNTEYTFQLVLRTTAGTFASNLLRVRTHTMADTSGISVCFGNVQDSVLLENAKMALREMGAKWSDKIQIDTTHFVCTTPAATPGGAQASGSISSAPGVEYQKALQLSIPVVQPTWILACHTEKKMVAIHPFYLGASPSTPINSAPFQRPQSMSQANLPSPSNRGSGSPNLQKQANRQSMPPPQRVTSTSPPIRDNRHSTPPSSQRAPPGPGGQHSFEPTPEEASDDGGSDIGDERPPSRGGNTRHAPEKRDEHEDDEISDTDSNEDVTKQGRTRKGTMSKNFKFPPDTSDNPPPPVPSIPPQHQQAPTPPKPKSKPSGHASTETEDVSLSAVPDHRGGVLTPSSVEVPPPPPVEKERTPGVADGIGFDELGETEEISLN